MAHCVANNLREDSIVESQLEHDLRFELKNRAAEYAENPTAESFGSFLLGGLALYGITKTKDEYPSETGFGASWVTFTADTLQDIATKEPTLENFSDAFSRAASSNCKKRGYNRLVFSKLRRIEDEDDEKFAQGVLSGVISLTYRT